LRRAATSGHSAYFLGTDSAPHVDALKEHACGCAGCFTATNTMPLLAHIFEEEGALNRLEAFTSQNGAAFYGLPQNEAMITLVKSAQATVFPPKSPSESGPVTVFDPGFAVHWHVQA
jgi:dihydroorotase